MVDCLVLIMGKLLSVGLCQHPNAFNDKFRSSTRGWEVGVGGQGAGEHKGCITWVNIFSCTFFVLM